MKTIGMIGGMSWESSAEYYRIINEEVKKRLGDLHSAKCVMTSVDFAEIEILQREGRWAEAGRAMAAEARALELAGADFIILGCTEIGLLVKAEDSRVPLFDTTLIHALAAVDLALRD